MRVTLFTFHTVRIHYFTSLWRTGTFKLDLSWRPLLGIFGRDMKLAEILKSNKNITFECDDESIASTAGIIKYLSKQASFHQNEGGNK